MEYSISEIAQKCNDADMILVGIGKEFQYDWDILLRNERYREIEKEIEEKEVEGKAEYRWIVPFMQKMALEEYLDKKLDKAYQTLKKLIEDRNYFKIGRASWRERVEYSV